MSRRTNWAARPNRCVRFAEKRLFGPNSCVRAGEWNGLLADSLVTGELPAQTGFSGHMRDLA